MTIKAKSPLFLCAVLGLLHCEFGRAQNNPTDKEVFEMLQRFYKSYILAWNHLDTDKKKLDSISRKYCEDRLLKKIQLRTKTGDLDYDPFLKAQDDVDTAIFKTMTFGKDPKRGDLYTFHYAEPNSTHKPTIHLIVNRRDGTLKIRDVY